MDNIPLQVWDIPQMIVEQEGEYAEYLRVPAMSMGIYKLPVGGVDRQRPHDEDEAYYVVSGRAKVEVEGKVQDVGPGSLIFVAATTPHRFIEIEQDLSLIVLFAPAFNSAGG